MTSFPVSVTVKNSSGASAFASTSGIITTVLAGGWTTILPTGTPQAPSGVGAGSRQIYVANASSGGSDSNAGTINAPFKTIQFACGSLRSGKSDQLFLACGDTFDLSDAGGDTGFYNAVPAGASAGPVRTSANLNSDLTASGPILIGSYQKPAAISTARPVVRWTTASTSNANCMGSDGGHVFNNVVVQGIDFYAYRRDPGNASFAASEGWFVNPSAVACFGTITYNLFEDCVFRFFFQNMIFHTLNNMPTNAVNINRCICTDAWGNGNAAGIFVDVAGQTGGYNSNVCNMTNSLFDQNGWNQTLIAPKSVTVASGTTFTWPTTPPFVNGCIITMPTSSGNFFTGVRYTVQNLSGNNFSLSDPLIAVGVAISTAGSASPRNMQWADPCGSALQRNIYIDTPFSFLNCITSNSSSEGHNGRQGGTSLKNLYFRNSASDMGDITDGYATISSFEFGYNVLINPTDILSLPNTQARKAGLYVENVIASGSSATIHDNIFAHSTGSTPAIQLDDHSGLPTGGVGGVITSNNIVWDWPTPEYMDDAGNAANGHINTTSNNTLDGPKNNNLPSPEPFNTGTAARNVASYSTSIGGAGTEADFLANARANSRLGGWDVRYTANPVINHIRTGFGLGSV